jgi:hypothetical protein
MATIHPTLRLRAAGCGQPRLIKRILVVEQQASYHNAKIKTEQNKTLTASRKPTRDPGDATYLVCYGNQNKYRTQ